MRALQQLILYGGNVLCPEHGRAGVVTMHIEQGHPVKFGYICLAQKDLTRPTCGRSAEWGTEAEMLLDSGIESSLLQR
jgi:hypothetical protein